MDVIFETQKGNTFSLEIGYFDTVLEIKEKIQKYKKIPISYQTLVFNGNVLVDDGDVESCVILDGARVRLVVAGPGSRHSDKVEEQCSPLYKKAQVIFRLPTSSKPQQLSLDLDLNESIEQFFCEFNDGKDSGKKPFCPSFPPCSSAFGRGLWIFGCVCIHL